VKKAIFIFVICIAALLIQMPGSDSIVIPNSNIKTVEFFIGQATTQLVTTATQSFTFSFDIPESSPVVRYAAIEINGVSLGVAGDAKITVGLNGGYKNVFFLGDGTAESQRFSLRYPFYPEIRQGTNGPYVLSINHVLATNSLTALNAKLILTYEYDSTSQRQLKTVKYFAGQTNTSFATGVKQTLNYSVFIPETGVNVTSAFLEINGVNSGIDNMVLGVHQETKDSGSAPQAIIIDDAASTVSFVLLYNATQIHKIKSAGNYGFNVSVNGTVTSGVVSIWGASAIVTYDYDKSETKQLNTVRYLIGAGNSSVSTGTQRGFNFVVPVAENMTVQSAFIKYTEWTGAATIADPFVNLSITGGGKGMQSLIDLTTDGTNFVLLYNASELYNMTGNRTEGPYTFNSRVTATGHTNQLANAELFLTYNYSTTVSVTRTKTVEYGYFNFKAPIQGGGPLTTDSGFFIIAPENNVSAKSIYAEVNLVDSVGAAHSLNISSRGTNMAYQSGGTSAESSYDYMLYNLSHVAENMSTGLNGIYDLAFGTSGLAAILNGKVIATYFFRP